MFLLKNKNKYITNQRILLGSRPGLLCCFRHLNQSKLPMHIGRWGKIKWMYEARTMISYTEATQKASSTCSSTKERCRQSYPITPLFLSAPQRNAATHSGRWHLYYAQKYCTYANTQSSSWCSVYCMWVSLDFCGLVRVRIASHWCL